MTKVSEVVRIIDKYTITKVVNGKETKIRLLKPEQVFIDDIGIGRSVTDRLKEMSAEVNWELYHSRSFLLFPSANDRP
jgi:hypothetical protein